MITIQLQQTQSPLFTFPLEIAIRSGEKNTVKSFAIKDRQTSLRIPAATRPTSLLLDPNTNLLFAGTMKEGLY